MSVQIEEEEELSTSVSTPVEDIPFVPKSESNEEWIPMDDMNQLQKTGEIYLFCLNHVICPVQIGKKYCRKLEIDIYLNGTKNTTK